MADDALPPIELQPPDISRWKDGGSGVDWVHVLDSGRPGPKAMVQALTHGNEICGAIALDWLLASSFRPRHGSLMLWMSSTISASSTKGRSSRARRSSEESRGPDSTASSQTRL